MKSKLSVLVIILLSNFLFMNCGSETEKTTETEPDIKAQYSDEVMSVHDEIMPLTMKIPPLKEDLLAIKTEQPEASEEIDKAIGYLQEAYDSMYNWMDEAGKVQSELFALEGEAAAQRLEKEKKLILYIQEFTNTTMADAKALKEKLTK